MFARIFARIKNDILGKGYDLSLGLVSEKKSREINKKYRKKDKATNVLSFAFSKTAGELVLCPAVIRKEAKNLGRTYEEWLQFLVIHGMLHLKGMLHGGIMERAEKLYSNKYDKKSFYRNRRRLLDNKSGGGRSAKSNQRRKKS